MLLKRRSTVLGQGILRDASVPLDAVVKLRLNGRSRAMQPRHFEGLEVAPHLQPENHLISQHCTSSCIQYDKRERFDSRWQSPVVQGPSLEH